MEGRFRRQLIRFVLGLAFLPTLVLLLSNGLQNLRPVVLNHKGDKIGNALPANMGSGPKLQVLNPIIIPYSVLVMDSFKVIKLPSNVGFHNAPMLKNIPIVSPLVFFPLVSNQYISWFGFYSASLPVRMEFVLSMLCAVCVVAFFIAKMKPRASNIALAFVNLIPTFGTGNKRPITHTRMGAVKSFSKSNPYWLDMEFLSATGVFACYLNSFRLIGVEACARAESVFKFLWPGRTSKNYFIATFVGAF